MRGASVQLNRFALVKSIVARIRNSRTGLADARGKSSTRPIGRQLIWDSHSLIDLVIHGPGTGKQKMN